MSIRWTDTNTPWLPIFSVTLGLAYRGVDDCRSGFDPTRQEMYMAESPAPRRFLNDLERLARFPSRESVVRAWWPTGFPPFTDNHDLNIRLYARSRSYRLASGAGSRR